MDSIVEAVELAAVKGALLRRSVAMPTIGRVQVRGILGRGGAGVVLDGYDPQLGRRVALKMLAHGDRDGGRRLRHEARALARLSHPGIVEVLDVGTHEDRAYLSMAFVAGTELDVWLEHNDPSTPARLKLVVQIAAGLQAVHDAGLTHGDVKPRNIIVDGHGAPVLIDFGLSVSGGGGDTEAGGTPGYQAPEVGIDRPADSRSDQFSLCVLARECIPDGGARLARVWTRGCSSDPSARFSSMRALVDAIARASRSRRWPWALAVVPGVLVAATLPAPPPCPAPEAPLSPTSRDAVGAALQRGGTHRDHLENTLLRLSSWSDDWVRVSVDVCERTRVQPATTAADDSRACLASSAREFATLLDLLREASDPPVSSAAARSAIVGLRPVARCYDAKPQQTPPDLDAMFVRAGYLSKFGRVDAALAVAQDAERRAQSEAANSVRAQAKAEVGLALCAASEWAKAEPILVDAYHLARQWQRDDVAAESAVVLIDIVGIRLGRRDDAERWLGYARALIPQLNEPQRSKYDRIVRTYVALLAINADEIDKGIEILQQLVTELPPASNRDPMQGYEAVQALGIAYAHAARWREAEEIFRRSYETVLGEFGPSVFTADDLFNLGLLQLDSGQPTAARDTLERAQAMYLQTGGPDHVGVAQVDTILAELGEASR